MLTFYLIGVAIVLAVAPFALRFSNIKMTFKMVLACLAAALLSWITITLALYKAYEQWRNLGK